MVLRRGGGEVVPMNVSKQGENVKSFKISFSVIKFNKEIHTQ